MGPGDRDILLQPRKFKGGICCVGRLAIIDMSYCTSGSFLLLSLPSNFVQLVLSLSQVDSKSHTRSGYWQ